MTTPAAPAAMGDASAFGEETRHVMDQYGHIFQKEPPQWALINANWIERNKRWLDAFSALVTALMLDLGIYTVRKSDPQNMAKYDQICQTLLRFVDRNGWNPEVHERALKDRLQTKMGLIKKQLIKEGRIEPNGAGAYVKKGSSSNVIVGPPGVGPSSRATIEDISQKGNQGSMYSAARGDTPTLAATSSLHEIKSEPPMSLDERSSAEGDVKVDVEQIKHLIATLNLDETSEVMGFLLDKLDGTDLFWALLVEHHGSSGAAEIERNLAEGVNREDITLESLVRMRKLAESRRLYHQNREGP